MTKIPRIGKCFDHLGGELAPFNRLLEMEWIKPKEGKKTVVTEKGRKRFKEVFDIDIGE